MANNLIFEDVFVHEQFTNCKVIDNKAELSSKDKRRRVTKLPLVVYKSLEQHRYVHVIEAIEHNVLVINKDGFVVEAKV